MADKVLIIEDSKAISDALQEQLFEQFAIESDIANTLAHAQETITSHPNDYFAASVDLQLPDGKNGAALNLVNQYDIPAIVYTGQEDPSIREGFLHHNFVDYVFKNSARSIYYISWLCHRILLNKDLKVLVVDDSPSAQAALCSLISIQGFQILKASSKKECLEVMKKEPNIDIVILDQFLPDGMGHEICGELRSEEYDPLMQIMGVSSKGGKDDAAYFLKSGGDDFLLRPFNPEEFIHRLNYRADYIEKIRELKHVNQEKNKFWSMATHDLRNPLGVILQATKRLKTKTLSQEKAEHMLDLISKSGEGLQHLLEDLLNISAIESGKLNLQIITFNLNDIVNERIELFKIKALEKNISLENMTTDSAMVEADPMRISQVIDNFLSNSIKYSPLNTHIKISIRKSTSHIRLSVIDEGPGVQEQDVKNLFKAFHRLGHRTTGGESSHGIGLSICKRIMDAHKGKAGYSQQSSIGSEFYFELPK